MRPGMADLFADYSFGRAWDEMFACAGRTRPAYDAVFAASRRWTPTTCKARADILARTFLDRGVTFDVGGVERPFPLDLIPRIIRRAEWDVVSRGVAAAGPRAGGVPGRRATAPGRVFADGVVPRRVLIDLPVLPPAGRGHRTGQRRPDRTSPAST